MLQEMGLGDSSVDILETDDSNFIKPEENLNNIKIETKQEKSNEKLPLENVHKEEEKPKETVKTGWDDTEFSDIDDENEQIKETTEKSREQEAHTTIKSNIIKKEEIQQETQNTKLARDFSEGSIKNLKEDKIEPVKEQNAGWSWSKIGTNFFSSAANLTSQLGGGLTTVLNTVEQTLGAPDPTELAAKIAKVQAENQEEIEIEKVDEKNDWNNDDSEWFTLPQLNKIASTGTQLVTGSLDVLETVGKKTIEIINDKDPNFKQTREFLKKVPATIVPIQNKPNLSQLLREAQSQSSDSNKTTSPIHNKNLVEKPKQKQEKLSFMMYFDEYKGVAHLEAFEMLSRQTNVKIEMLSLERKSNKNKLQDERINSLEYLFDSEKLNDDFEMDEMDNSSLSGCQYDFKLLTGNKNKMFDVEHFEFLINDYSRRSNLKLVIDKIICAFRTASYACREELTAQELYNESIKCFALITANIIELYHKAAEALLIEHENGKQSKTKFNTIENSEILFKITKLFIRSVTIIADDYCKKAKTESSSNEKVKINQIITDIYLEASNSNTYIGDAFLLFLPIFKSQLLDTNDKSN